MNEERQQDIVKIVNLQLQLDELRKKHDISKPGECIFSADLWVDGKVIVEADGFGGADVALVDGNWPVDFNTKESRNFNDEKKATFFADCVIDENEGDGDWEEGVRLFEEYEKEDAEEAQQVPVKETPLTHPDKFISPEDFIHGQG